jgi:chromosome segregation ATPase
VQPRVDLGQAVTTTLPLRLALRRGPVDLGEAGKHGDLRLCVAQRIGLGSRRRRPQRAECEDDSGLIAVQSKADRNRVTNARSEVIDELLAALYERVTSVGEPAELRAQVVRLNETVGHQSAAVADLTDNRRRVTGQLAGVEREAFDARQRAGDLAALVSRFGLLSAKYTSDLDRLEMIEEAGTLLGFFSPGTCVFCGAEPGHQHLNDHIAQDSTHFGESVAAERHKTAALKADLLQAIADLELERDALTTHMADLAIAAEEFRVRLRRLDKAIAPQQVDLTELLTTRSTLERHVADTSRLTSSTR